MCRLCLFAHALPWRPQTSSETHAWGSALWTGQQERPNAAGKREQSRRCPALEMDLPVLPAPAGPWGEAGRGCFLQSQDLLTALSVGRAKMAWKLPDLTGPSATHLCPKDK